jgi:hypothetical protein
MISPPKLEGCKQLVKVKGYITVVRYDLWTETSGEECDGSLPYHIGWTKAKAPRQRWCVSFPFDASKNSHTKSSQLNHIF